MSKTAPAAARKCATGKPSIPATRRKAGRSPLLSNLVLDELGSEKAGRVMQSVTRFIERRLKLQVNAAKSAVDRPWRRSFLSFTLRNEPELRRCIAAKAVARFKHRVRELTGRHRGVSLERMIRELAPYLRG